MKLTISHAVVSTLFAVALVACGDDKDGDGGDDLLTGTFVDGPVAGLHFATETQTGRTNAAGEFTYAPGETVTFSVGGITLGSAPGAERVTPFDLFGIEPPSTALALRAEANDHRLTAFKRVANVALFLQALDADADPSNGIDLGEWDSALADASLSFETGWEDFAEIGFDALAASHPGMRRGLTQIFVMARLYAGLGLAVPVDARTRENAYAPDGFTVEYSTRYTYDALSHLAVRSEDFDADGDDDFISTSTFDTHGHEVTTVEEYDDEDDGVYEHRDATTRTFDASGNLLTVVREVSDAGGLTQRSIITNTFDAVGNLLTTVEEQDSDADGDVDYRRTSTNTYDGFGRVLTTIDLNDDDADGAFDYRRTQVNTYDAAHRTLTEALEYDHDNDTVVDQSYLITNTRDAAGNLLSLHQENFAGGVLSQSSLNVWTYDDNNQVLTETSNGDYDGNGTDDRVTTRTSTYDGFARELTYVVRDDFDGNGAPNFISTRTKVYDANGNELTDFYEADTNNDSVINNRSLTTQTYDANGARLETSSQNDSNADGVYESTGREGYERSTLSTGVIYILEMLEFLEVVS